MPNDNADSFFAFFSETTCTRGSFPLIDSVCILTADRLSIPGIFLNVGSSNCGKEKYFQGRSSQNLRGFISMVIIIGDKHLRIDRSM